MDTRAEGMPLLPKGAQVTAGDLRYLLSLGLTVEEIAARAARTPLAITKELEKDEDNDDN